MAAAAFALGAFQIISGFQQAELIRQQGQLKERIAEINAEFAEIDAFEAERLGFTQAIRFQSLIDSTISDTQLAFAAADVDVNFGTAKEIIADTKVVGILNTLDIQKQARERAAGFKAQARQFRLAGAINAQTEAAGTQFRAITRGLTTALSGYNFSGKASSQLFEEEERPIGTGGFGSPLRRREEVF